MKLKQNIIKKLICNLPKIGQINSKFASIFGLAQMYFIAMRAVIRYVECTRQEGSEVQVCVRCFVMTSHEVNILCWFHFHTHKKTGYTTRGSFVLHKIQQCMQNIKLKRHS